MSTPTKMTIVLMGQRGVGKTCFLRRVTRDEFPDEHQRWFENEYDPPPQDVEVDDRTIEVKFHDTLGGEWVFREFDHFRGADFLLCFFDLTDWFESFGSLCRHDLPFAQACIRDGCCPNARIILVGTKSDVETSPEIRSRLTAEIPNLLKVSLAVAFYEISSQTREGIQELLQGLLEIQPNRRLRSRHKKSLAQYFGSMIGARSKREAIQVGSYRVSYRELEDFRVPEGRICFAGWAQVVMEDQSMKSICDVSKGDVLCSSDGSTARVVCVVQTRCDSEEAKLVQLVTDGVDPISVLPWITSWHPVRVDGQFVFPIQVAKPVIVRCKSVYNLVLDSHHVIEVNGVDCVTLGHGFVEDPVVKHPFFGTEAVVEVLQKMKGWDDGLVELRDGTVVRDDETGLVCGLKQ